MFGAFLVLYVGSFAVLASCGGYLPLASGHFRPFQLAAGDRWIWQPRYGLFYSFRDAFGEDTHMADRLGYFYAPLICIHRWLFRPTIPFVNGDGSSIHPHPRFPTRREIHPLAQAAIFQAERDFQLDWDNPSTWPKPQESK